MNLDKKVYVLSIGDYITLGNKDNNYQKYIMKYFDDNKKLEKNVIFANDGDYRIIDLLNDIKNNKEFNYKNKVYTLNNSLIKADIIFISIGMNDLMYNKINNNYDYIDDVLKDLDKLLKLVRKYSKERIFIFNYYNLSSNDLTNYVNKRLVKLVDNYNINIIDISFIKNIDLTGNDYNYVGNEINKYLKKFY